MEGNKIVVRVCMYVCGGCVCVCLQRGGGRLWNLWFHFIRDELFSSGISRASLNSY